MKKILGLDLGTNSIGWALVDQDFENHSGKILGLGSRIIPMSQDILGDFDKGNSVSQTAERTRLRSVRRLRERHLLRRERLHRVLHILQFLPEHYTSQIDFRKNLGKFLKDTEPKLAYQNGDFLFRSSFNEMLEDFNINQPELLINKRGDQALVPYDWTIYYLRFKALTKKIHKHELAWILLHFNQKRGYYQLRGEEETENPNKLVEFHSLKITEVMADPPVKGKDEIWYSIILENGWMYRRASKIPLFDWQGKTRDFIVTTDLNEDGTPKTDKEGTIKRSFRAPGEDDWTLLKKKTENEIEKSTNTVGEYIYKNLLKNPNQKIKGKLIRTIERKFYKDELKAILKKQSTFHQELTDETLFKCCIDELYTHNESHKNILSKKDFVHLFTEDIIFYQRPLKSKKSQISECPFEKRNFTQNGELKNTNLKCVPKSHPLYQEFRLWQWIKNLKIYQIENDKDVTIEFLNISDSITLIYDFLNERKSIKQDALIRFLLENAGIKGKVLSQEIKKYYWNYVQDKEYPCNETRAMMLSRFEKVIDCPKDFLTPETEEVLWHIIYSVTDKIEFGKALKAFAKKFKLDIESFKDAFEKHPPYKNDYGAFSLKALKKLLPLMRTGKYWDYNRIDENTKKRIDQIINAEYDESIRDRVRQKSISLTKQEDFQGLPLWLTSYIVYDRHSEGSDIKVWKNADELDYYINSFKQHSLRNPIVEQVITESLRVVRDIWQQYGLGINKYFDEIHIELGREMKNPADKRKQITEKNTENENTNFRIKALLIELMNDSSVQNVRPHSPIQQELLKIYEEGVLNSNIDIPDDIVKISKAAQPSTSDLNRYKLWLEQKYRSPYTGKPIPLSKLFTSDYEIEHIIPQSRYFDDSFSNKVICESAVNKLKDNQTGMEFIINYGTTTVELGHGQRVKIFTKEDYETFVKENYSKNRTKKNKLLMEDVPESMIERQINDTRYISKFITQVLSAIVRDETNDDGVNSKNVIPCTGQITSTLKEDWGLNNVWNDIILPRFERMNTITGTQDFTSYNERYQKVLPTVPTNLAKGFQKKRIDHRHHAMDALVIAAATRNHINYLNNQNALDKNKTKEQKQISRIDLRNALCIKKYNEGSSSNYQWVFKSPWTAFTKDAKEHLEHIVISFKQNLRVINKTVNFYQTVEGGTKKLVKQSKGESWAIRKPMHKDTVSGLVKLRKKKNVTLSVAISNYHSIVDKSLRQQIKTLKGDGMDDKKILQFFKQLEYMWNGVNVVKPEIYFYEEDSEGNGINTASRVSLDTSFNAKKIESITDTGIQKILLRHLENYAGHKDEKGKEIAPELLAFSPEGIEEMNKNMVALNLGKDHKPILKVRTYEPKGNKFMVGYTGNKNKKFVEAAKGTNLFFAIYTDESGKRSYDTIPLNIVIERQKQGLPSVPETNEKGHPLLFHLSPNDLVYIPSDEERENPGLVNFHSLDKEQVNRIYKMVSSSGTQCFFVKHDVSNSIVNKVEFSALNKTERSINEIMIKECCWKLSVNRLGKITAVIKSTYLQNSPLNNQGNIIAEPATAYQGNKNISFYSDFNNMEKSRIEYALHTDAMIRIKDTVELIRRVFGTDKCLPGVNPKKLYFK
jgi:CRISPR-associated endonuclease Csn1